ncbi:hypothetical protein [Puniceibacterium sp. IMCC21224]|nr:hypothetical protein [Puniceibacterium sp. IMCC21224]KMK67169.1 hypothetical protein IMCC21224_112034 [Puniceibacterium sp. IMCC21224]
MSDALVIKTLMLRDGTTEFVGALGVIFCELAEPRLICYSE